MANKYFFGVLPKKNKKKSVNGGAREVIAKLSRGLMLPIAMLPIAGLFLGIGNAIVSNSTNGSFINIFGQIIKTPGGVIFDNLPVLFAVAIAIAFSGEAGVCGLSAFVGWIVFCAIQSAMIVPAASHVDSDGQKVIDAYNFLFYRFTNMTMFSAVFTNNLGIQSLCTSVFGGLTVGFTTAFLYNKFHNIELPTVLGFFSGVRFIPIITFLSMIVLSFLFSLVWPGIGMGLFYFGQALGSLAGYGGINAFLKEFINRSLGPFGLHHAFYTPLWYTSIGGHVGLLEPFKFGDYTSFIYGGQTYQIDSSMTWKRFCEILLPSEQFNQSSIDGDQKIWMFFDQFIGKKIEFIDGATAHHLITLNFENLSAQFKGVYAGQYLQANYSILIFALPTSAIAMVMAVPKGPNRKVASSIILSAALTSFLTGITEPLEFTFLFLAPWLYWGFHAVCCGLSGMFMVILHAHCGMTFSAGLIDYFIYCVLPDAMGGASHCWAPLVLAAVFSPLYYFVFYFSIIKFDIKTPGREGGEMKLYTKKDYLAAKDGKNSSNPMHQLAIDLIEAHGGRDNIKNVDACITKLRVQVADRSKANKDAIIKLGARGVMYPSAQSVYSVFGTQADRIKNEMKDILSK